MAGYLIDEHLLLLPGARQLLAYALNRSSHLEHSYYYHKVLTLPGQQVRELAPRLPGPSPERFLQGLPAALQAEYRKQPGFAQNLPDRLPYLVLAAAQVPRLLWVYLWQSPEYRLRRLNTETWEREADIPLTGWCVHALDPTGQLILCSEYPRQQQMAMFRLDQDQATLIWQRPMAGEWLQLAQASPDQWVIGVKQKRSYLLHFLDQQTGETKAEVRLKTLPQQLTLSESSWLVSLQDGRLQWSGGSLTLFDKSTGGFEFALSPSQTWLAARSYKTGQMQLLHLSSQQVQNLPLLAGRQDHLSEDHFLLRKPGFAITDQQLWTLLGGEWQSQPLPLA